MTRVLIIGSGSIGKRHHKVISENFKSVQTMLISSRGTQEETSLEFGVDSNAESYLHNYRPDIVVLANPAPFHLKEAEKWLGKCRAFLIEKPLSTCTADCIEFLKKYREHNLIIQIGYNLRFLPSLIEFRKAYLNFVVGLPYSIRVEVGQYLPKWRPETDYSKSVSSQKYLGGGALLELSHELDYVKWIFGRFDWIFSFMGKKSQLEIDVEDLVQVQFGIFSPHGKLNGSLQLDFLRHDTTRQCLVIGEKGTLRWDGIAGSVCFFPADGNDWINLYQQTCDQDESYRLEWKYFLRCLQTGAEPSPGLNDGIQVMRIIDAIRESNETGNKVMIRNQIA